MCNGLAKETLKWQRLGARFTFQVEGFEVELCSGRFKLIMNFSNISKAK